MKRAVVALVSALALAGLALGLLFATGSGGPQTAAPFSLSSLAPGAPLSMPVVRDGRRVPVVLTFFASWCGPCHADLPIVAGVADQILGSGRGVAFLGIDGNDDPASGLAFARQSGVHFPVGKDPRSIVAPSYGLPGYPGTVFVDAAGRVVHVVRGPISAATLRTWTARIAPPA